MTTHNVKAANSNNIQYPETRISNLNLDIFTRFDMEWCDESSVETHVFSLDVYLTAAGHGLPGVYIQVQHNLIDLASINLGGPDRVLKFISDSSLIKTFFVATEMTTDSTINKLNFDATFFRTMAILINPP